VPAKTWKVAILGQADYATINAALLVAKDGDTIKVMLGKYDEKVVVNSNVVVMNDSIK
jgi:pectin methylesterase-like acyl-CoA thioesterase